jgi:translation initiation factor IF-2
MVPVSAKTGQGMDDLLEMVLLTADLLDLRANPDKQAKGTVIEAKLDKNRGPVATVLVQRGTLRTGDTLVTGSIIGHVRAMTDDKGNMVEKVRPSVPVEILVCRKCHKPGKFSMRSPTIRLPEPWQNAAVSSSANSSCQTAPHALDTLFSQMACREVKDLNIMSRPSACQVESVRQSLES